MKTLLKNLKILGVDCASVVDGSIGIDGQKIAFVGELPASFEPDEVIDGKGKLAMPGLVNAHTHIAMSLMRGYADDLAFWPWLNDKILPLEENLDGDMVYWGSSLSCAEMIASGTTCFADMYFFCDDVARSVQDSGLRASLCRGLTWFSPADDYKLAEAKEFTQRWQAASEGKITTMLGPHAPYTCSTDFLCKVRQLQKELDIPIHIHLSESLDEMEKAKKAWGKTPIAYVADLGLLDGKAMAAHCVQATDADLQILAKKQTFVAHNPSSNMKLANGFAPVSKILDAGVGVALGTDGPASNNNQNMFEEMHLAALVGKALTGDPEALPARQILQMATIEGAKALGLQESVGSLEKGKQADIVLLDLDKPHLYPAHDLVSLLVYSAQASDVSDVWVAGRRLYANREFVSVDFGKIKTKVAQILPKFLPRR